MVYNEQDGLSTNPAGGGENFMGTHTFSYWKSYR
jgi:hypothetical protein